MFITVFPYIKFGEDFCMFSNYQSHICVFSSEADYQKNVDHCVNTDLRIHLFLSTFVRFNTEPA